MLRRFASFLLLAGLLVPTSGAIVEAAPHHRMVADPTLARIILLINANRAAAGLAPVFAQDMLMAEAQRFSGIQASLGRLSHRGVDGTNAGQRLHRAGYRWSFWGENLAAGQENADAAVAAWMASPSHRANVMNPKARQIGIGHILRAGDPARYFDYWVMEVGRPG